MSVYCVVFVFVSCFYKTPPGLFVLGGLVASVAGDAFMLSRSRKDFFLLAVASFFIAHMLYIAAIVNLGVSWLDTILFSPGLYLPLLLCVMKYIKIHYHA